ncbi:YARHG domain-containing protein, partial [Spirulina sp. 06S082]|uniref:YARHG domain-containing protein n=1 Tax=Spirulina sp. 06S082 TaxID=3110248 RepID=UPI002B1FA1EC
PGFMPSEQSIGRPVFSSDLYSLGLTAIYLLTGKVPQALTTDPLTGEIVWRELALNISPSLGDILDKTVKSHARDRFSTAREMLAALQSGNVPISPTVTSVPPAQSLPQTVVATPTYSNPSNNNQSPIILGSLILGGFACVGVVLGLVLTRPPRSESPTSKINEEQETVTPPSEFSSIEEENNIATPSEINDTPLVSESPSIPIEPSPSSSILSDSSYSWLSDHRVTETDLQGKSARELSIMRNSIFARKGRIFRSPELQSFFNSQPWYRPIYSPDQFPSSLVTPLEQENAQIILQYQNQYGLRWIQ